MPHRPTSHLPGGPVCA
nr:unnamed protein product [Callosobruchus chinensis]